MKMILFDPILLLTYMNDWLICFLTPKDKLYIIFYDNYAWLYEEFMLGVLKYVKIFNFAIFWGQ